ncbi:hypothetical protein RCF98_05980 [Thiothrix lacustris]|uniref:Uncharacterized protein n=1 Tax=Thiothrix lacustris TaxID=525917 RepID=A0ABY9MT97_9GAMM|nr:hypothetical protein [Thiothrix lacustris]WML91885.1 hypothetical protein RCF98_05980 [Thiothrix lacustris]
MHDIDGTLLRGVQSEWENDGESEWGAENEWETQDEFEFETADEFEAEADLDPEDALASEMLELESEAEMEQFLGGLIRRAAKRAVPLAKQAGRFLYKTAQPHLKQAWKGIGNDLVNKGSDAARGWVDQSASRLFGEMPSAAKNRAALNVARKVVQAAQTTGKQMARLPPSSPPAAVKTIVTKACQQYFPPMERGVSGKRGTWVRQGNKVILFGL